jgi:S1-C subfamily serine protease
MIRLLFAITLMGCVPHLERAEVFRNVAPSSVVIETEQSVGSGAIVAQVGKQSLVLTCAHVVKDHPTVTIQANSGVEAEGTVLKVEERTDLALVLVNGLKDPPLYVAQVEPAIYDTLYVVTSPLGIPRTASEAVLYSKTADVDEPTRRWAFTGFMLPGSSGGPITNQLGEIVCVAEAVKMNRLGMIPELGYCVGLKDIRTFLHEYKF